MKKKILAFTMVIVMLAIAIVGGTLAYFTDDDAATNTFTVGSVDIELLESQLHRANDKATDEQIIADDETYQDEYLAVNGKDIVPGRWVKKAPYILNTGKNPAYVRVRVLINETLFENFHMMQTTTDIREGAITGPVMAKRDIDGVTYDVLTYTYTEALEPDELTYWPAFWQFKLDDACDNADVDALIEAGAVIVDEEGNCKFDILVEADAIQSEGFADAAAAFAAFDVQRNSAE